MNSHPLLTLLLDKYQPTTTMHLIAVTVTIMVIIIISISGVATEEEVAVEEAVVVVGTVEDHTSRFVAYQVIRLSLAETNLIMLINLKTIIVGTV